MWFLFGGVFVVMSYDGRTRKCWYALLACVLNPRLSVAKAVGLFGLKEVSFADDSDERRRERWRVYYEQNRERVIERNRRCRERMRGK